MYRNKDFWCILFKIHSNNKVFTNKYNKSIWTSQVSCISNRLYCSLIISISSYYYQCVCLLSLLKTIKSHQLWPLTGYLMRLWYRLWTRTRTKMESKSNVYTCPNSYYLFDYTFYNTRNNDIVFFFYLTSLRNCSVWLSLCLFVILHSTPLYNFYYQIKFHNLLIIFYEIIVWLCWTYRLLSYHWQNWFIVIIELQN